MPISGATPEIEVSDLYAPVDPVLRSGLGVPQIADDGSALYSCYQLRLVNGVFTNPLADYPELTSAGCEMSPSGRALFGSATDGLDQVRFILDLATEARMDASVWAFNSCLPHNAGLSSPSARGRSAVAGHSISAHGNHDREPTRRATDRPKPRAR